MIREATADDIPRIVEMGARFIDTEYPGAVRFNAQQIGAMATALMNGNGAVFVVETEGRVAGMMAMTTYEHCLSGDLIATEVVWWVEPESRGGRAAFHLFAEGEKWARAKGATKLQMIAPSDKVGKLYERLGFERIEVHYQRSL